MRNAVPLKNRDEPLRAPCVAVGAIVIKKNRILLVERGKAPSRGKWSIPGGSVHLGETLREAVEREIKEETGLRIKAKDPVYVFDYIEREKRGRVRFHYVIIDFSAERIGGRLQPADDARDAGWFTPMLVQNMGITESTREFLKKIGFTSEGQ